MDFNSFLHQLLFGYYPYVCLSVFFVGSLLRYDREQYTWKSDSSQLLRHGQLRWGSNLFHIGVLLILFGHIFGLLTPLSVWHALGVTPAAKQLFAIIAGSIAGLMATVGGLMLLARRLRDARIMATSTPMDIAIMLLLLAQILLGLATVPVSANHLDGGEMLKLVSWAQLIWTFRPGAAEMLAGVSIWFKLHLVLGLTVFLLFPFTRLVHIWSGLASVIYLVRPYQIMRSRGTRPTLQDRPDTLEQRPGLTAVAGNAPHARVGDVPKQIRKAA
jgi:nitrate reductase gamma subunit